MKADSARESGYGITLLMLATLLAIAVCVAILFLPVAYHNTIYDELQALLPILCLLLALRVYISTGDEDVRRLSGTLVFAFFIWIFSLIAWYIVPLVITMDDAGANLFQRITGWGWLVSYGLIAASLLRVKWSRQLQASQPLDTWLKLTGLALAIVLLIVVPLSANGSYDRILSTYTLMLYLLVDILILTLCTMLIFSNLKVNLKYLVIAIGIFFFLNSAGDLLYEADRILHLGSVPFFAYPVTDLTSVIYNLAILFMTSALFVYTTHNLRDVALAELRKKLKDTSSLMDDIIRQSPEAMCIFDDRGRQILVNDAYCSLFYTESPGPGKAAGEGTSLKAGEKIRRIFSRMQTGETVILPEVWIPSDKDDSFTTVHVKIFPVHASDGSISRVGVIFEDITERVKLEHELKESLKEKEILVKEVHHRTKNNLQIISSLLSIQAGKVEDPESREIFRESQNRIRSMALVHEKLYRSRDLAHVDFSEYVQSITAHLLRSYSDNPHVRLKTDIDEIFLDIDQAIPCGLIINELLSNSLKHAFPGQRPGEVTVALKKTAQEGGSGYVLTVRDNGIGLGAKPKNPGSIGLDIVYSLCQQIGGKVELDTSQGTAYTINFKAEAGTQV